MRYSFWFALAGQVVRFLMVLAILWILAPQLFAAFHNLYEYLFSIDRIPSGNPLKVEVPMQRVNPPGQPVFQVKRVP